MPFFPLKELLEVLNKMPRILRLTMEIKDDFRMSLEKKKEIKTHTVSDSDKFELFLRRKNGIDSCNDN